MVAAQGLHHDTMNALVVRRIVLLAQQDYISRQQLVDERLVGLRGDGIAGACQQGQDYRHATEWSDDVQWIQCTTTGFCASSAYCSSVSSTSSCVGVFCCQAEMCIWNSSAHEPSR